MKDLRNSFLLPPPDETLAAGRGFLRQARFRLREDYLFKISRALAVLNDPQVWHRPNAASNSIGNLLLHLAGNLRQWIVSGVGGVTDVRERDLEFAARESLSKGELLMRLSEVIDDADKILAKLEDEIVAAGSDQPLQNLILPQGYLQTTLDAVFHAVEHFSYHTGQVILLAKWQAEGEIKFYNERELGERA
jgi:uncharacterized damage-inducible protein DinB